MNSYGTISRNPKPLLQIVPPSRIKGSSSSKSIHEIWRQLERGEVSKEDRAGEWLWKMRGIESPRQVLKCGFANLAKTDASLFDSAHQSFVTHRAGLGPQLVAPLRGTKSDEVKNIFFRSITNISKEEKSRLLPNAGGWTEPDGSPRSFGFPHLIKESPHLILCEGMADYFAAEFLIKGNGDFLSIGASNADGMTKWAKWLVATRYKGVLTMIHQLDGDNSGALSTKTIGPAKAVEALRYLKENQITTGLFDWPSNMHQGYSR
jgi:hypothetical protein